MIRRESTLLDESFPRVLLGHKGHSFLLALGDLPIFSLDQPSISHGGPVADLDLRRRPLVSSSSFGSELCRSFRNAPISTCIASIFSAATISCTLVDRLSLLLL